ncbi:MAG: tetratricopeptide repeat protein, partial [Verrucomicrobiota bacterium]
MWSNLKLLFRQKKINNQAISTTEIKSKALFVGREQEQRRFREIIKQITESRQKPKLPNVILVWGQGGIGKSSVCRKLRDISEQEFPSVNCLFMDWEDYTRIVPGLSENREAMSGERMLRIFSRELKDVFNWNQLVQEYDRLHKERDNLNSKGRDFYETSPELKKAVTELVKAGTISLLGGWLPAQVAQPGSDFLESGTEQAWDFVQTRYQSHLQRISRTKIELLLTFDLELAKALGKKLAKLTRNQPFLVIFDTYEVVDRRDRIVRELIRWSGNNVVWIISGRDNLFESRAYGTERSFLGYAHEEGSWFSVEKVSLGELAKRDIIQFFQGKAQEREQEIPDLTNAEVEKILQATWGVPFALKVAADIWVKEKSLDFLLDITNTNSKKIVGDMVDRYHHLCVRDEDQYALHAIALAGGDRELLDSLLVNIRQLPSEEVSQYLKELARNYAVVYLENNQLHDAPAYFYNQRLQELRHETWVQNLHLDTVDILQKRLQRWQSRFETLADRCDDEDWQETVVQVAQHFLAIDEDEALRWIWPRWLEARAYNSELSANLLSVLEGAKEYLTAYAKRRHRWMKQDNNSWDSEEERHAWERELNVVLNQQRYCDQVLEDDRDKERRAIVLWRIGQLAFDEKHWAVAGELWQQAALAIEDRAPRLAEILSEKFRDLGWAFNERYQDKASLFYARLAKQLNLGDRYSYMLLVLELILLCHYDEAMETYQELTDKFPTFARGYCSMSWALMQQSRYNEAVKAAHKAVELEGPDDPLILGVLCDALLASGDAAEALRECDLAIERMSQSLFQNPWELQKKKLEILRKLNRSTEAIELCNSYLQSGLSQNQKVEAYNCLGLVFENQGDYKAALEEYEKACQGDPSEPVYHTNRADIHRREGRYDEALAACDEALRVKPGYPIAYNGRGLVFENQGDYKAALEEYEKACQGDPSEPVYHASRADIHRREGRYDEALAACDEALRVKPGYPSAYNGRGLVFENQGDYKAALEEYEKACQGDPSEPVYHTNR